MKVSALRVGLHVIPVVVVLGWLVPLVDDALTAYLLVGTIVLCSWLLGAVQGLSASSTPTPDGRNPQ